MQYLLSPKMQPLLLRLARTRTLCAFDFDGTLAPIVDHPALSHLRRVTRQRLRKLATLYPCAVLSGRARTDLLERLRGLGIHEVVGSHGADIEAGDGAGPASVRQWRTVLEDELGNVTGVWVEDKGHSLAVHYRQALSKGSIRARIFATAQRLPEARVFGGKDVVNLMPASAPDKGTALAIAQRRFRCDWVLYVGDDENDEDAFALAGNLVAVRIGQSRRSRALYYLRSQNEIDELLRLLTLLRALHKGAAR